MLEPPSPRRSTGLDWKQWCYPGPRRDFTPDEMARAGGQPWPWGIDHYLLVNMAVLLLTYSAIEHSWRPWIGLPIGLALTWMVLAVARWLWRRPSRKRLNIACWALGGAIGGGLVLGRYWIGKAVLRDWLTASGPLLALGVTAVASAWWILVIYRADSIEARLRELAEQAERERLAARLGAAQIQPHFLFNTLASLQHWVETGDARAAPLLRDFSAYLRATLPMFERERQALCDELTLVRSYLAIMQARLGERLSSHIDVEPGLNTELPPGVLLTLVENAIRHGIEPQLAGGRIGIKAQRVGQLLVISVRDDGSGLSPQVEERVGLSNTRRRLRQAYGDAASLSLTDGQPGCLATLKLPP